MVNFNRPIIVHRSSWHYRFWQWTYERFGSRIAPKITHICNYVWRIILLGCALTGVGEVLMALAYAFLFVVRVLLYLIVTLLQFTCFLRWPVRINSVFELLGEDWIEYSDGLYLRIGRKKMTLIHLYATIACLAACYLLPPFVYHHWPLVLKCGLLLASAIGAIILIVRYYDEIEKGIYGPIRSCKKWLKNRPKTHKQPAQTTAWQLFLSFLEAKRDKVCPTITFVD